MEQPEYDTLKTNRYTAVPKDIVAEADYEFYTYVELHGDPNGGNNYTA